MKKLNVILSLIFVILIVVGFVYLNKQTVNQVKPDDQVWFKTEKAAIQHAEKSQSSSKLTFVNGTGFNKNGIKIIPAYFRSKRMGEGFMIIEIKEKNHQYTDIPNNAGAAFSYPPGIPNGKALNPGLVLKIGNQSYILLFGRSQTHVNQTWDQTSQKNVKLNYVEGTNIFYYLEKK